MKSSIKNVADLKRELHKNGIKTYKNKATGKSCVKRSSVKKILADKDIYAPHDEPYFDEEDHPKFNTINDAETWFSNSGVYEWEWFEGFDEKDFVKYLYQEADGKTPVNDLIEKYLEQNNQNPKDYGL